DRTTGKVSRSRRIAPSCQRAEPLQYTVGPSNRVPAWRSMMRGNWSFGMLSDAVALTGLIACQGMSSHAESQSRGGEAPVQSRPSGGHRFGLSTPPPRTKGALRLATYNVLNLFDHVDDPSLSGEYDDINMATADERCRMLAEAIRAIDADIVALQEV